MAEKKNKKQKDPKKPVVMIVDDEEMILDSLSSFLSFETDYELITYQSPSEALKILNSKPVDLIISDFLMPEMNGLQFLKEVKKVYPDVPRIILTGYADKENAINAINEVGLFQYIEKPWDNDNLKLIIRNGLQTKNLNEQLEEKLRELDKILMHRDELAERDSMIKKELSLARRLQDNILPQTPITDGNINICARYKPALEIGGDFFDVIHLEDGRIAILVADVTGHGIQAALSTMLLKFAFSSFAEKDVQPTEIIKGMNKILQRVLPMDIFVAALVITMDIENCQGMIVNGGLPSPFLINQKTGEVKPIPVHGLILGITDDDLFQAGDEHEIKLGKDECLMIYTDGISEIEEDDGKHFEDGYLFKILSHNANLPLDESLDKLLLESEKFRKSNNYWDDITLVGISTILK